MKTPPYYKRKQAKLRKDLKEYSGLPDELYGSPPQKSECTAPSRVAALPPGIQILLVHQADEIKRLKNPWISVQQELPEKDTEVLVRYFIPTKNSHYYSCGEFKKHGWTLDAIDEDDYWISRLKFEVTHWMPIPPLLGDK